MANEVMQNTDGFATQNDQPVNNDAERARATKKGHGYNGPGYGGGRDQTRPLPPTAFESGRAVCGEGMGYGQASLDGSESHVNTAEGAPYVGSPGAKGANAKKVPFGSL